MKDLVQEFTSHIEVSLRISAENNFSPQKEKIENVIILGMGGSGIGGSIASQVLQDHLRVPVVSCKDYTLPNFVGSNTLVIVSSYSGNTEETLMALETAITKTKLIASITSGGKLLDICGENSWPCMLIPGGIPPRAAFGYSFPQVFHLLHQYELIDFNVQSAFQKAIDLIKSETENIKQSAWNLSEKVRDKLPIIYTEANYEGVGIRFRQQLNENSKKLCWHHALPEMNHNELVGWKDQNDALAVIFIRNEDDQPRTQKRFELCKEIISKYTSSIHEVTSKGSNKLERSLYLVHLCDWVSVYIAEMNERDPIEIEVINYLKGELSKI